MAASTIGVDSDARAAGARSVFYHALATLFRHPDRQWAATVRSGNLFIAAGEAVRALGLPACLDALGRIEVGLARNEESLLALSADYVRLFGAHGEVNCPPLATEFGKRHAFSKVQDLADIGGFYRAFGLAVSRDPADRLDHICFLFDFLSFLAIKQLNAIAQQNDQDLAVTCDAEREFFCRYIGNWVPQFCETLGAKARSAYYRELGWLLGQFVGAEVRRFGLHSPRISV